MYNHYEAVGRMKILFATPEVKDYHLMTFIEKMEYWRKRNLLIQETRAKFFFSMIKKQNWR